MVCRQHYQAAPLQMCRNTNLEIYSHFAKAITKMHPRQNLSLNKGTFIWSALPRSDTSVWPRYSSGGSESWAARMRRRKMEMQTKHTELELQPRQARKLVSFSLEVNTYYKAMNVLAGPASVKYISYLYYISTYYISCICVGVVSARWLVLHTPHVIIFYLEKFLRGLRKLLIIFIDFPNKIYSI